MLSKNILEQKNNFLFQLTTYMCDAQFVETSKIAWKIIEYPRTLEHGKLEIIFSRK